MLSRNNLGYLFSSLLQPHFKLYCQSTCNITTELIVALVIAAKVDCEGLVVYAAILPQLCFTTACINQVESWEALIRAYLCCYICCFARLIFSTALIKAIDLTRR